MKITAADLQRHYRNLADEELLSLVRGELSDTARQCYDREIARRALTAEPVSAPALQPAASPDDPFVTVIVLPEGDARIARSVLESAEIPVQFPSDQATDIYMQAATAAMGVPIMVPASCLAEARELLEPEIRNANKAIVRSWLGDVVIEDLIAEGDRVAARLSVDGQTAITMARVCDGEVVESWTCPDLP